jgi:hypothetical protein
VAERGVATSSVRVSAAPLVVGGGVRVADDVGQRLKNMGGRITW